MQGRQAQTVEGCVKPRGVNLKATPGGRQGYPRSQDNKVREGRLCTSRQHIPEQVFVRDLKFVVVI